MEEKLPPALPLAKTEKKDQIGVSVSSVADPGCLSRIPYPDPDFLPIPDPGSATLTVSTYIMGTVRFKQLFLITVYGLSSSTVPLVPCQSAQ
jgi:hypothetical protein